MAPLKLLISSATGYNGGSILNHLLNSEYKSITDLEISAIIRGEDNATILKENGISPILFRDLDDAEATIRAQLPVSGFHTGAAKSSMTSPGERCLLHPPITNARRQPKPPIQVTGPSLRRTTSLVFLDTEDVYSYLVSREKPDSYSQCTTDVVAVNAGLTLGESTYLVMPPTIYGRGTGLFNTLSIQPPTLIRTAIKKGVVEVISDGYGVWNSIQTEDLSALYELLLSGVLDDPGAVPAGKRCIFISDNGDFTWLAMTRGLAAEINKQGLIETAEAKHISLQEAADQWTEGKAQFAELAFASK